MPPIASREIAAITGLSLRQLRYLAQSEVVVPSLRAHGRGFEGLYSDADLFGLLVVERVRQVCGPEIRVERLRAALKVLRSRGPLPRYLVIESGASWTDDGPLDDLLTRCTAALVIDLQAVDQETQLRLRRASLAT